MKFSKAYILHRVYRIPELRFEDQRLSSFSGLVVFQALAQKLALRVRLRKCFDHLSVRPIVGFHVMALLLVVHLLLGYRRLREMERYKDDPLVLRALGLRRLPNVSTVTRRLSQLDSASVNNVRRLNRGLVLEPLAARSLARLTLDFDGSVVSTGRFAEGTAVGFNPKKKGMRSYYPLFCTIAQTGQVLDLAHRPGNVHDSHGAEAFILNRVREVRSVLPAARLESRLDSAFFADHLVELLDGEGVEFTISVPFERFSELKAMIEARKRWRRLDGTWSYFESSWSPKCWKQEYRFLFIR